MTCPRCGYPTQAIPCQLCAQDHFDEFEMSRFHGTDNPRFELTIVCMNEDIPEQLHRCFPEENIPSRFSTETSRYYLFLPDSTRRNLKQILNSLSGTEGWRILINGRYRPFIEELWLPLLDLTEVS
jgi:hypothetical protein